jgi:hypothetical protein
MPRTKLAGAGLGRWIFDLCEPRIRGELRSLRDPSEPAEEDILVA